MVAVEGTAGSMETHENGQIESMGRVLLVEDDAALLAVLKATLAHGGFEPVVATSGGQALEAMRAGGVDAVLLDLGLPDCDGRELLCRIRNLSDLPILVVSGRPAERDRIEALDLGADDFVPKPFLPGELLARLRAALRRWRGEHPKGVSPGGNDKAREPLRIGALTLDPLDKSAALHGLKVQFNVPEYRILVALAARVGDAVPRNDLIAALPGCGAAADSNVVDVYISRIRSKLRTFPEGRDLIANVRGHGWRLRAPA
ncbi:MAG TPA: response regulator transcription factor [Allosphingosinicella sp.]|nr:response regulator transcription factor [Allosphingosinicella sp.]